MSNEKFVQYWRFYFVGCGKPQDGGGSGAPIRQQKTPLDGILKKAKENPAEAGLST